MSTQLRERPTKKPGTTLTQVRVPGAPKDFSPRVNLQCRLSYGVRTATRVQSHASVLIDWLMITYIALFSAVLSRLTALACGSTCVTSFLIARFLNIHRSGVLTALAWLVPHETAAVSAQVLCTPYNHALCHFMQSYIRKVYACLAVTCHLHFWQNDRDLLRATAVTRGWNGYRN